jgi:hypothetical protein
VRPHLQNNRRRSPDLKKKKKKKKEKEGTEFPQNDRHSMKKKFVKHISDKSLISRT